MAFEAIEPARWAAIRALREGGAPTYALLAGATGIHLRTIKDRAAKECWAPRPEEGWAETPVPVLDEAAGNAPPGAAAPAAADGASAQERLGRVMDFLVAEVERIGTTAHRQGRALDKRRIEAVWSMIRTLEKVEGFSRVRARENQTKRDGEMADVLRRIDERIVELAHAYAQELGARQPDGAPG